MTKSYVRLISIALVLAAMFAGAVLAQIPQVISYQGRLTDNVGDPVTDGVHAVVFSIYDAPTAGVLLWTSGEQNVTTQDGLFSYELGSNVQIPDYLFKDTIRYLGIRIVGDVEMTPLTRLETVPYAYHALRADTAGIVEVSAGLTQDLEEGGQIYTGYLNPLATDSIECPNEGYVIVNLTVGLNCNHTNGQNDALFILIVDSTGTITQDMDNRAWLLPSSLPSAFYATITGAHKVFPVTAGWNKYLALASHQNLDGGSDNCSSSDVILSLLYIPSAYGTVDVAPSISPKSELNSLQLKQPNR